METYKMRNNVLLQNKHGRIPEYSTKTIYWLF